jgi:NAD(P)-dependent dehydrogenase (short-subunit alcohol dehydrogenase family)
VERVGHIDLLVNNAGATVGGPVEAIALEQVAKTGARSRLDAIPREVCGVRAGAGRRC